MLAGETGTLILSGNVMYSYFGKQSGNFSKNRHSVYQQFSQA